MHRHVSIPPKNTSVLPISPSLDDSSTINCGVKRVKHTGLVLVLGGTSGLKEDVVLELLLGAPSGEGGGSDNGVIVGGYYLWYFTCFSPRYPPRNSPTPLYIPALHPLT